MTTPDTETLRLLQQGEITIEGLTRAGSNYTFAVNVARDSQQCMAIYKPRKGEAPLWDFPSGTLYKREYAAYLLCRILGWDIVPLTIIRDGPHGIGSLQLFIDHDPHDNYYTIKERHPEQLKVICCFDLLANNADRKPGHCILGEDDKVWSIDHGLTFSADMKVRTVIWDFGDEPIPDELMDGVEWLQGQLPNAKGRLKELLGLLAQDEVNALAQRCSWLLGNRTYPGLYRPRRRG